MSSLRRPPYAHIWAALAKNITHTQETPGSPILFLIYISEVFSIVEARLPNITCISFVDNLGFLTSDRSISKVARLIEKAEQITLEW